METILQITQNITSYASVVLIGLVILQGLKDMMG